MSNREKWSFRIEILSVVIALISLGAMIWIAFTIDKLSYERQQAKILVMSQVQPSGNSTNQWVAELIFFNEGPATAEFFQLELAAFGTIDDVKVVNTDAVVEQQKLDSVTGIADYWVKNLVPSGAVHISVNTTLPEERNGLILELYSSQDRQLSDIARYLFLYVEAYGTNVTTHWISGHPF